MAQSLLNRVEAAVSAIPYSRDAVANLLHTAVLATIANIVAIRARVETVNARIQIAGIIANTIYLCLQTAFALGLDGITRLHAVKAL